MNRLLQQFEAPVTAGDGTRYNVYLYGRERPGDTWQAWLEFERMPDGMRFTTDVETTQPDAEAILYWATGLTDAYFDGALARALKPRPAPAATVPGLETAVDSDTRRAQLADVEREVLGCFRQREALRLLTQAVFDELPHAHATVVRALEDLEKQGGLLVRRTEEGSDWLFLTERGVDAAGLTNVARAGASVRREPPRMP
jgi:hypothetical protein